MNFLKIKTLAENKGTSIPELASKIGMSKAGLYSALENGTLKVEALEKISQVLAMPIQTFFDPELLSEENDRETELKKFKADTQFLKDQMTKQTSDFEKTFKLQQEKEAGYKKQISMFETMVKMLEAKISEQKEEISNLNRALSKNTSRISVIMKFLDSQFPKDSYATKFEKMYDLKSKLDSIDFYELKESLFDFEQEFYKELLDDKEVKKFKLFEKSQ